ARAKDQEQLERHHLMDCIECGACAYVCPSHIPLVQYYRSAKGSMREASKEARFEARQERLERETAAREAKRAARKAAAEARLEAGDDPVQAAIERAKAKKAQQEGEQ
ncbi:4Fe-4S dicluster domain-containing protein, partial [Luminiphilus sp.]|nr:4Fe-4S dicluster domain-containing protein [Luminiphilus sp.]